MLRLGRAVKTLAVVAVATVATGAVVMALLPAPPVVTSTCTFGDKSLGGPYAITPTQAQNADVITAVGLDMGLPDHAATVAIAASLQETRLQNLTYGDRDSIGLFQQRPSQHWGTAAQIMDPSYAAGAFYAHLAQVPGWESLSVTEAAQTVQRSATPDAYAQWSSESHALAQALTGEIPAGLSCRFRGYSGATPPPAALANAASAAFGLKPFDTPAHAQRGWQVAVWAVANANAYHLTSVSFGGKEWTSTSGRWASAPVTHHVVTSTQ